MARLIMYAIRCSEPDCREVEALVEGERRMGDTVTCEQGHDAVVRPAVPRAIGILVDHFDPQTGKTFTSNRQYEDWKRYSRPVMEDGEVVGYRQIREYSHDELDAMSDQGWREQEEIARSQGRTLEEDAKFRAEGIQEKIARETEKGLVPSVKPIAPEKLLPP